nr:Putate Large-conductance mechanosensitive channel [Candidatus Pantoea persica]
MPLLGLLIGGVDFKQFKWVLKTAEGATPPVVMEYGVFIQTLFDFIIVAFAIFVAVKLMNKLHKKKEVKKPAPKPSNEEVLLTEIRDLLKQQNTKI